MSQILKSLQLPITGSTPSTPPSGFGTLYASGSNKLFYKNPSGTEFDLLKPNGYIEIRYYTGSAIGDGTTRTYTWSKPPAGLKYIEVCCVGAGGGGGGGPKRVAPGSNPAQGGLGGSGGTIAWGTFDASILSSSYTITIGAGGAGGAGTTSGAASLGSNGSNGGTSSFGTLVIAAQGRGGVGGGFAATKRTQGSLATQCTPAGYPHAYGGCGSATVANVPSNPVGNAPIIFNNQIPAGDIQDFAVAPIQPGYGGAGGGNGGSFAASGIRTSGSRGSDGYQFTTLITNGGFPGSASNGQNATAPTDNMITTLLQFTGSTTLYGLGGGGHGGASAISPFNGGRGSDGGLYGAGGGGGGSLNYTTALSASGDGGSGSSGLCIVVEFY
jgi:hypothetical protein